MLKIVLVMLLLHNLIRMQLVAGPIKGIEATR